jgi:hypothetical protein
MTPQDLIERSIPFLDEISELPTPSHHPVLNPTRRTESRRPVNSPATEANSARSEAAHAAAAASVTDALLTRRSCRAFLPTPVRAQRSNGYCSGSSLGKQLQYPALACARCRRPR